MAFFTDAQTECLVEFARQAAGAKGFSPVNIRYRLLGSEDSSNKSRATAMLEALQSQNWDSVARHNAVAGCNNLLLGILLRLEAGDGRISEHWIALRSPFEILDGPEILAAGEIKQMPRLELRLLQSAPR